LWWKKRTLFVQLWLRASGARRGAKLAARPKPAGSDLGSFLMIYRNWGSVFLIKKSVFLIKNRSQKFEFMMKNKIFKKIGLH